MYKAVQVQIAIYCRTGALSGATGVTHHHFVDRPVHLWAIFMRANDEIGARVAGNLLRAHKLHPVTASLVRAQLTHLKGVRWNLHLVSRD
jgi:hypothetical protein